MPTIPHTFATYPAGTFPASDWDANWSFVAALTNIYCTVGGSGNTILLFPATTSPAVTGYQTGMVFTFVAAFTNTAATTANVSAVGPRQVFNSAGVALAGFDIVAGTLYSLTYDQALGGGGGGFRLGSGGASTATTGAVNVLDHGASPLAADNTAAFQSAINATPRGGTLYIPSAPSFSTYKFIGSGSTILFRDVGINIIGDGFGSSLTVDASVPNTRDFLTISPAGTQFGFSIRHLSIGASGGRHMITFPGANTAQFIDIESVLIGGGPAGGGNSIRADGTGGIGNAHIFNCNLESIYLNQVGDAIVIENNAIGGTQGRHCVRANFVAGGAGFVVTKNVLAGTAGSVVLDNGQTPTISYNEIETPVGVPNTYGTLIDIGVSAACNACQLIGNQYSVLGGTGNPLPIRVRAGCLNTRIDEARITVQTGIHVQVDATAGDTIISRNGQTSVGVTIGLIQVIDNGISTRYARAAQRTPWAGAGGGYFVQYTDTIIAQISAALGAPRNVNLPAAFNYPTGAELVVVDEGRGATGVNTISLVPNGGDLINGVNAPLVIINAAGGFAGFISDGNTKWSKVR